MGVDLIEIVPGLYQVGPVAAGQETYAYFLLLDATSPPQSPTLDRTWNDSTLTGWYLFLPEAIPQGMAQGFATGARQSLPALPSPQTYLNIRGLVWLNSTGEVADPAAYIIVYQLSSSQPQRAPINPPNGASVWSFPWSNFSLQLTTKVNVGLDTTGGVFSFNASQYSKTDIQLFYNGQSLNNFYINYKGSERVSDWLIQFPMTGPGAGALAFTLAVDWDNLSGQLWCGFGYFYPAPGAPSGLVYPLFPPRNTNNNMQAYLGFAISLHPIYQVDPRHTYFAFDFDAPQPYSGNNLQMVSPYFQTAGGATVQLVPHSLVVSPSEASPPDGSPGGSPGGAASAPAGFTFCKAPAGGSPFTSPPEYVYYLAPVGPYRITSVSPPGSPSDDDVQLMCGLFAQEFLQARLGDIVEFVGDRPAWASGFTGAASGPPSSGSAETLTADFTTSWVRYPAVDVEGARGYYGQPSASVFYAPLKGQTFPTAVNSLLSLFPEQVDFPVAPYGGIYQTMSGQRATRYNAGVGPGVFKAFEASVLSSVRHAALATSDAGPIFRSNPAPTGRNPLLLLEEAAGDSGAAPSALTPQGLLVHLNDDGTWHEVVLAKSPDTTQPDSYLKLDPPLSSPSSSSSPPVGRISPSLSNVLLGNQLFLVVSNPAALETFQNELYLCGFNFLLDVNVGETILIFKYNTSASLKDLVSQTSLWADPATFVGGSPSALGVTQSAILQLIAHAEAEAGASGNPFGYFNGTIASRPEWTGIIALNCAIDGNNMPPDLAMLLGGISGRLRAHHFGVEANRVQSVTDPNTGESSLALQDSSLFGVIFYQNPNEFGSPSSAVQSATAPDFEYAVETLTVVFSNSSITQFVAKVGLTINRLFGREVSLVSEGGLGSPPPVNTLIISGQYQSRDGVGTLTFVTDEPIRYDFPVPPKSNRVLDHIVFTQASLAPVSAGSGGPTGAAGSPNAPEVVQANFSLGGQLWFSPDPFPGSDDIDLFSYGTFTSPGTGMAFSGLVVNITFTLDDTGMMIPGSETLALQPSLLNFTPGSDAIRAGSLLNSLPLQLSRFWYAPEGLTAAQLGAAAIHVLQLEGQNKAGSPPSSGGSYPYVTSLAQYALEYDLPLGSLGALSSVHAGLTAKLLLAWGPSPTVPGNDAAAVFVQLPQVMAGYGGFDLQGILKTTFGDANLLKVDLPNGSPGGNPVYAILFNNIQLSIFGYSFPPGVLIDFAIFAGKPQQNQSTNTSNIAWFLAAMQTD